MFIWGKIEGKVGPAGIKSEGDFHPPISQSRRQGWRGKSEGIFQPPITLPYAPAQGSGDGGIGSLFALNPDAKGGGPRGKSEGGFRLRIALPSAPAQGSGDGGIGSLFALNPDAKGEGRRGARSVLKGGG